MEKSDKLIKDLLKMNMQKIEDVSFNEIIINCHFNRQKKSIFKPFLNFGSLIFGISSVIISIGLILMTKTDIFLDDYFVFKEQYGLILLIVALIFLISNWIENFITPKNKITNSLV
jgi:hypothetical protein